MITAIGTQLRYARIGWIGLHSRNLGISPDRTQKSLVSVAFDRGKCGIEVSTCDTMASFSQIMSTLDQMVQEKGKGSGFGRHQHSDDWVLVPDQAALSEAAKLLKSAKWSGLGPVAQGIWGDCQGSAASPYRVATDPSNPGSKGTCPTRNFPSKHGLAQLLLHGRGAAFPQTEVPLWVADWMGAGIAR